LGFAAPEKRVRFGGWAALFAVAAGGKLAETLFLATPYEKATLHGGSWAPEAFTAFLMTPLLALLPALAAPFAPRRAARYLWAAAFGLGLVYSLAPGGWGGALCYRKFGLVLAAPLAWVAGREAWRYWRAGGVFPPREGRSLLRPALLFAVMLSAMALSWRASCGVLRERLAARPGAWGTVADLPRAELSRGMDHWSTTALSLILQGWSPQKVHVWNAALQQGPAGFCICPGDPIGWKDGPFKAGWLASLRPVDSSPASQGR
jgi:hypothetical protein